MSGAGAAGTTMKLRIITGSLKGRSVVCNRRAGAFRPTLERHRESVAQILQRWVDGARVADVCAGSGVCGFELLSRGAAHVDFVECDRARARAIETAARQFGVEACVAVYATDARRFAVMNTGPYDIVYFDPPYGDEALAGAVCGLLAVVVPDGVLAFERSSRSEPRRCTLGPLHLVETRQFGTSAVDFYAREPLRRPRVSRPLVRDARQTGGTDADSTIPGNI